MPIRECSISALIDSNGTTLCLLDQDNEVKGFAKGIGQSVYAIENNYYLSDTAKVFLSKMSSGCASVPFLEIIAKEVPYPVANDIQINKDLDIWSIPTSGPLWVKARLNVSSSMKIDLVDLNGRVLQVLEPGRKVSSGEYKDEFKLEGLLEGIYFLRITLDEQQIIRKVLKR